MPRARRQEARTQHPGRRAAGCAAARTHRQGRCRHCQAGQSNGRPTPGPADLDVDLLLSVREILSPCVSVSVSVSVSVCLCLCFCACVCVCAHDRQTISQRDAPNAIAQKNRSSTGRTRRCGSRSVSTRSCGPTASIRPPPTWILHSAPPSLPPPSLRCLVPAWCLVQVFGSGAAMAASAVLDVPRPCVVFRLGV